MAGRSPGPVWRIQYGMDYYAILAVDPSASAAEIRRAFYRAALRFHPDKNAGQTSEEFAIAREAFETLSDPNRRANHDRQLGTPHARERQEFDMQLRKEQMEREQQYFALKLAHSTPSMPGEPKTLSKEQLKRETQEQKAALAELWQDHPKYRTLTDGRIFDTVKEARHFIDTHPGTALLDSLPQNKYSTQFEEDTLERLKLRSAFRCAV